MGKNMADKNEPREQTISYQFKPEQVLKFALEFQKTGQLEQAERYFKQLLQAFPKFTQAHFHYSRFLLSEKRFDEARDLLIQAEKIDPDNPHLHFSLAKLYRDAYGDMDHAKQEFNDVLELTNYNPMTLLQLAQIEKCESLDNHLVQKINEKLKQKELKAQEEMCLNFALGKLADSCGEYETAFNAYQKANSIRHQSINLDVDALKNFFLNIEKVFSQDWIQHCQQHALNKPELIFIVGMPRSGTSLIEQILASHPDVYPAGESYAMEHVLDALPKSTPHQNPVPFCVPELTPTLIQHFAKQYWQEISAKMPDNMQRLTDKMPSNFFNLGLICCLFKNVKIIHCKRNPVDTCLSNYFQLFEQRNDYAYDLNELVVAYKLYEHVMAHWQNVLPIKIHEVVYEDFVNDVEQQTKALIEYVDLPWDKQCLEYYKTKNIVATSSAWQIHQPIFTSSVNRWKHYEKFLGDIPQRLL